MCKICWIQRHLCNSSCWVFSNQSIVWGSFSIKFCQIKKKSKKIQWWSDHVQGVFSPYPSPACYMSVNWKQQLTSKTLLSRTDFGFPTFGVIQLLNFLYCILKIYLLFRELCFTFSWDVCRLQNLQALSNLGLKISQPNVYAQIRLAQTQQQAISLLVMTLRQMSKTLMVPSDFL